MRKSLGLILCLFVASTLVAYLGCKKKEEAPPAPTEEIAPALPEVTAPVEEAPPAAEAPALEETPATEETLTEEPAKEEKNEGLLMEGC
jgi:hypothetical protein